MIWQRSINEHDGDAYGNILVFSVLNLESSIP